ncbi:ABC transporter permease [Aquipuribacter sp. MA13-6]|uniref:ABC transporter permease n=1 Tax=unclassified Aquipuribacter TaxID=2635084 RepID=UPI003EF02B6C
MSLATPGPAAPGAHEPETAAATAERHGVAAAEDARAARRTGLRSALELVISPVVAITAAVVAVVVMNGDLDEIEARALATDEVLRRVVQHLDMSVRAVALIILIAVPLGVLFSRPAFERVRGGLVSFLTLAQALPPLGVMFLLPSFMGFGLRTAVTAIVIAAVLPVLRNVLVGLERVDRSLIEASRGMGMSNLQTLLKVELPLAVPVILTGIRVSLVLAVGAAVFGAFINAGGLGYLIDTGQKLARGDVTLVGALLVASLALTVDWLSAVAQRVLRPRGL